MLGQSTQRLFGIRKKCVICMCVDMYICMYLFLLYILSGRHLFLVGKLCMFINKRLFMLSTFIFSAVK